MADAHKNFAYSTVATAPSPASSGTSLVVAAGNGALFPAVPFNATIWPTGTQPLSTNAEIVRVTARATDTLTITRAQEGTSARTVVVGDQIAATITGFTLRDAEIGIKDGYSGTTGCLISSFDRRGVPSSAAAGAATSGTLRLYGIPLPAGLTVTTVKFWAGTTAGASLTHSWVALCDASLLKLAVSADVTTATWTASTSRAFTLSSPYVVTVSGWYYVGLVIAGTTIPTIEASTNVLTAGSRNDAPISGGNSTTGLSVPGDLGSSAAAISVLAQFSYFEIS